MNMESFDNENFFLLNYKRIAANIKAQRMLHHYTQATMAEKMGMDTQYYAVLERGDTPGRNFTLDKVLTACKVLKCTPNDIIGTDFIVMNHNREILIEKIDNEIKKMTEKQLNVILSYVKTIMPMI